MAKQDLDKTKKPSFFSKMKKGLSRLIPDSLKRYGKRIGLTASIVVATAGSANAASAPSPAPAEQAMADSITSVVLDKHFSMPTDNQLKLMCDEAVHSVHGKTKLWDGINYMLQETGEQLDDLIPQIHGEMGRKNKTAQRAVLNKYLGKNNIENLNSNNYAPSSYCSWAANRVIALAAQRSGAGDLFSAYTSLLDNVNYASANFGHNNQLKQDDAYKKLFKSSQNSKNLKQSLLQDIADNPNDIFLVAEYSPRSNSKHHIIIIHGDKYFSFNNQSIGSSEARIKKMTQRYYINISELTRQNVDEQSELTAMSNKMFKELKKNLSQKQMEGFFARKLIDHQFKQTLESKSYADLAANLNIQQTIGGQEGTQIVFDWLEDVKDNTKKNVLSALSSSQISSDRKEEIREMYQDMVAPNAFLGKDTKITEQDALDNISDYTLKSASHTIKKILGSKNISEDNKRICAGTIYHILNSAGIDTRQMMNENTSNTIDFAEAYNLTQQTQAEKAQKIARLTQKKKVSQVARKELKHVRKKVKSNQSLTLKDIKKLHQTASQTAVKDLAFGQPNSSGRSNG